MIIPYDIDRCFGITRDFNVMNGMTELEPLSTNTFQGKQRNNLLLKTILSHSNNECKKDYLNILEVIKNSNWVKSDTFKVFYNQAKSSYSAYSFSESNENMSFDNYISRKISKINGDSSSNEEDKKVYDNLYVVGNFNSWGNYPSSDLTKYKMEYLGNYEYQIVINIESPLDGGTLKFKFNNGFNDYSQIDWAIDSSLTILNKDGGGKSTSLSNINVGDKITIKINTNTLEASVKIESSISGGVNEPNGDYNIYIVGNFNSWGNYPSSDLTKSKFEYLGENTYQVIITINGDLPDDILQFKINAGGTNYNTDWTFNSDLTLLVMNKGDNAMLNDVHSGDQIKIRLSSPIELPVYRDEALKQEELQYPGFTVHITNLEYEKDPFGEPNTIVLTLQVENLSDKTFSCMDITLTNDYKQVFYPSVFGDTRLMFQQIKPGDRIIGKMSFAVNDVKGVYWLTFYDRLTKKELAKISLDNAYKGVSNRVKKRNERIHKKKENLRTVNDT